MSYYSSTGQSFKHPILGDLQVLQDSTQTQILRCRIDRFHTISESRDLTRDPQTISHPNIIKLNHTTPLKNEYFDCSFEYFSNTLSDEIRTRIRKNARYDEDELIALMKDIGRALCYLQSNRSPYRYINGDTIVKVNSGYKLLHPVLLAGYQNQNEQTVSSINLSQINIPDETNDYYQKAFDSDHERYRRDIYDFGLLILNAMTLSNDVTLTAAQKLKIASSYYSQELVGLVSKMLEKIISLRMDCIACDYFIENLANSSRTADSFSKRRASGTNLNLSGIKYTQNSNLTLDNLSITLDYPRSTSARPERMKKDEEPKNTDEVRSSRTMFREILKTALPTPQNRDAFFADLPSDLSDEAEDLLTKTFSVKTPRAKPEPSTAKFTDLSLETHNKDNSFYSTVETTRKTPYSNSNLSQVLDRRPANSIENIQNDEDYYPRQFEAHSAREDRSEYSQPQKVPVNIKPKARGRVGVDPLTYVAKKRNLQLDDIDSDYTTLESKKEKEQRIQPPSTKSKKIDYFKSPNLHEKSPLANISDYSAFDNGVKDHSTDCLTNTPSTNERKSPYGFLTTYSNNIETAKPKQKTFIFGKENNKAYKVNHAHAKKSNGSRGLKRIKNKPLVNNDIRLPSFGDDYGHSESDEYDVNELSDHNEDLLTTPNSTTTLSRKNYFTPNETVSPNRPRSPTPIRFITEVYPDGSVYQGEGYHNLRHGIGRLVFRDGSSYEGEWNQDNIEGFGVFFAPNGTIAYEGEWQNNKCNGQGVHYNEKSRKITAVDLENLPRKKEGHWKRYEGGLCNDKWEGEGKLVFSNGDEYCGDFVSDLIHGFGKYITKEGVVYEGEWANNQLIKLAYAYNSFDGQE